MSYSAGPKLFSCRYNYMKKSETHAHKTDGNAATVDETITSDPAVPTSDLTPEQIEELKARAAKADEHWDRLLRTTADLENFKKRAAREKTEAIQFANASLLQRLLPILDNFEMAQTAAQSVQGDSLASLQAGVAMIQQQLKSILTDSGLEEIDAGGKLFDPALHEAVSQQETVEVPENHVVQQIRKGYKLRDRLLRPASVIVAKPPAANS